MPLFIFARFHARPGCEAELQRAIVEVGEPTRAEPGCTGFKACRAVRDPQLFFIHSGWIDEEAFEHHIGLAHTVRFISEIEDLIEEPAEIVRTEAFA